MPAAVTPRSAARWKSGRTMISGRTRLALELTAPTPFKVRRSRTTACAAASSAAASSLFSTSCIFTPLSCAPTWKRAPGSSASRVRICASMSLIEVSRSLRWASVSVSTARRASAAAPGAKTSPLEPPPTDANTPFTPGTDCAPMRACSATAHVSASVLPGGSSTLTCVCARSLAGTKPVGSSPTSATEPAKNRAAPSAVAPRWFRHQRMARM
jgi:hypothetical protein